MQFKYFDKICKIKSILQAETLNEYAAHLSTWNNYYVVNKTIYFMHITSTIILIKIRLFINLYLDFPMPK